MVPGRALRLIVAAALLLAWQGALVHPITHADGQGGLVHAAGLAGDRLPADEGEADALCDAIAAVSVCVGGAAGFAVPVPRVEERLRVRQAGEIRSAPRPAYRSQAPPQFS